MNHPKCHVAFTLLLASCAVVLSPVAARADILYTFSGVDLNNGSRNTFSFEEPSLIRTNGWYTASFNIEGVAYNYVEYDSSDGDFLFSSTRSLNGLSFGTMFPDATRVGTYQDHSSSCSSLGEAGVPCESVSSLTISDVSAVTPEPPGIALLGTGFIGVAGIVRRRSQSRRVCP